MTDKPTLINSMHPLAGDDGVWPGWLDPPVEFADVTWVHGGPYPPVHWGMNLAKPGTDRTVVTLNNEPAAVGDILALLDAFTRDDVVQALRQKYPEAWREVDREPASAPTDSETALHRAMQATRRDGE